MFTDIVGYSAMMAANETKAMACLGVQRAVFQRLVGAAQRKEMGDGTLSSFASANEALACARAIQDQLAQQSDFKIRIGLHIGEATFDGDDIFGDAVNIAARVEPLAEAGGIAVSAAFYEAVRSQPGVAFDSLGEQSLKNIGRPIEVYRLRTGAAPRRKLPWKRLLPAAALALALLAGGIGLTRPDLLGLHSEAASDAAIAVLPFADMSQEKDQEFFSDGLSEELLNLLSKLPQLRVIARTSSFAFKGKPVDIGAIGKRLNVGTILNGSVRKSGNVLRITTQLIRVSDSTQLWSETYDRQLTDVFKLQDEIANAVVGALKIKLLPAQKLTNVHQTASTEAYQHYLLGNQFLNRNTPEGYRRAIQAYHDAITIDPGYAAAYAAMAMAEHEGYRFSDTPLTPETIAQAKRNALASAEKAIALAPDLALGHAARGFILMFSMWDWNSAKLEFEKALALDPADATIERRYGLLLAVLGQLPQGIATTRKAIDKDPLSMFAWSNLGSYLNATGQYAEARKALGRALDISADSHHANGYLGQTELLEGHAGQALLRYRQGGEIHSMTGSAMAEFTLGHTALAQTALDAMLAKHSQDRAFRIAQIYAWRGDKEQAFNWLERAFAQHDSDLGYIKYEPMLASLRGDPRFAALVKKIGL